MSENLEILTETMVDTIPQPDDSDYPQLSDVGEEPSLINEDPLDRTTESQDDYGEPNDDYEQLEFGIEPDIPIAMKETDADAGKDTILETAIQLLLTAQGDPARLPAKK